MRLRIILSPTTELSPLPGILPLACHLAFQIFLEAYYIPGATMVNGYTKNNMLQARSQLSKINSHLQCEAP